MSQRKQRPSSVSSSVSSNGSPSNSEIKTGTSNASNPGASGVRHRTRAARVAAHFTYYGLFQQVFDTLQNVEMRKQIALVIVATFAMCLATEAWNPPFSFVEYDVPDRDIVCRIAFSSREEKPFHTQQPRYFDLLPQTNPQHELPPEVSAEQHPTVPSAPVTTVPGTMPAVTPQSNTDEVLFLQQIENENIPTGTTEQLPPAAPMLPPGETSGELIPLGGESSLRVMTAKIVPVAYHTETHSATDNKPPQTSQQATATEPATTVHHLIPATPATVTAIPNTTPESMSVGTSEKTGSVLGQMESSGESFPKVINDNLPGILTVNENDEWVRYFTPGTVLVPAGQPITGHDIRVLQAEFAELMAQRHSGEQISRFFGVFFLTLALFLLAFIFLCRRERRRPQTTLGTGFLYSLMVVTVIAASIMHDSVKNGANLELIPMLLFSQGIAVAFSWELALVLMVIVSFVFVLSQANSIFTMVLIVGVSASIVIHLGRLRSRTKLIVVGSFGALIAFLLTLFIEMTEGQEITRVTLTYAVLNAFWTCAAAFLMTGLLPFIERPCGILTDMSLLELGDPSHPLLHELTRRAPATFSHSLQVASIAETAAEMIGARGLLVRVGAYFHDIGKILNPEFFTENQQVGQNVHDHLEPRMSTLVIVAHVKDGVDLVRQHRVPQPIVNLVEQHHGTSLVSFFHSLASRQNRDQGYSSTIDEGSFRYPGPKPQSKEAGVLMLADAAESACRSLRDASPGKIEAMVRHISEDKLKDGQFDESGLTLRELRTIEKSIINSILAMRHNRISYPDNSGKKPSDSTETKLHIPDNTESP